MMAAVFTSPVSAQTLSGAAAQVAGGERKVSIFADGSVRDAIRAGNQARLTTGALGIGTSSPRGDFSVSIAIAGSSDTLRSDIGATMLAPGTGGSLSAGLVDARWRNVLSPPVVGALGVHTYVSASSAVWAFPESDAARRDLAFNAAVLGWGVGLYKEVLREQLGGEGGAGQGNFVSVLLDGGVAYRGLYGDLATTAMDTVRARLLGDTHERHLGVETGVSLQVNSLVAGLTFYRFFGRSMPGFSDGQIVAGISFQADLFSSRSGN
jgi:hypothetical protein